MTEPRVSPTEKYPTHHVSFEQGDKRIALVVADQGKAIRKAYMPQTTLQISQADSEYAGFEMPYTPITQKDFSGGRGQADFEDDKTRYADSYGVDASRGPVVLAPLPTKGVVGDAAVDTLVNPLGSYQQPRLQTGENIESLGPDDYINRVMASAEFTWNTTKPLENLSLFLGKVTRVRLAILLKDEVYDAAAARDKVLALMSHRDGFSYALEKEFSIPYTEDGQQVVFRVDLPLIKNQAYVLSATVLDTYYGPDDAPVTLPYLIGTNGEGLSGTAGKFIRVIGGVTYTAYSSTANLGALAYALRVPPTDTEPGQVHFFNYRGSQFMVHSPWNGDPSRLYIEGRHGYIRSDTFTPGISYINNAQEWMVGAKLKIIAGPGATEETRWRKIKWVFSDPTSGEVGVSPPWCVPQTRDTEYAIVGTGTWGEVTFSYYGLIAPPFTKPVTDVCVCDDVVYFAQGEDAPIIAMRAEKSADVAPLWQLNFRTLGPDHTATFLKLIQDEEGKKKLWRAKAVACKVSSCDLPAWGADPVWSEEVVVGNTQYRISNIEPYGDPRVPWVGKEDGFGAVKEGIYDQVPLGELAAVANDTNCRAMLQRGLYLYFGMLDGLERYYMDRLDDIGPNRDEGLPENRRGYIRNLVAYPGRMYAAIDHLTGYSSVMLYNDTGWHEVYRGLPGNRLLGMGVQVIPGEDCDRLWIAERGGVYWLPVAINPAHQADYRYTSSGYLETSWFSGGYKQIVKFWKSILIYCDNLQLTEDNRPKVFLTLKYKVDSDDAPWVEMSDYITDSPVAEVLLKNNDNQIYQVTGRRIKFQIGLHTTDPAISPKLNAITVNAVTRVPQKRLYTITFLADTGLLDMGGRRVPTTPQQTLEILESFADSNQHPAPVLMRGLFAEHDSQYVFIEPTSVQITRSVTDEGKRELGEVGQLSVYLA